MSEEEKTIGERLEVLDKSIAEFSTLLKFIRLPMDKPSALPDHLKRFHGSAQDSLDDYRDQLRDKVRSMRDERKKIIRENPIPPLVCPYCGYDGDLYDDKPKENGFRLMRPILDPRLIMQFDGTKMILSDRVESFEQFECVSDIEHNDVVDGKGDGFGEDFTKMREMLRGKWLILCGRDSCLKYFDAEPWSFKSYLDVEGSTFKPLTHKWKGKI